jgi:hypothetical protein
MKQRYARGCRGALHQQTHIAVPWRRDKWNVAELGKSDRHTLPGQRVVRRKEDMQGLSPQVHSLDIRWSDVTRDDPEVGKTAENILDDRCAVAGPKLNTDVRSSFAKRTDQRWKRLVEPRSADRSALAR